IIFNARVFFLRTKHFTKMSEQDNLQEADGKKESTVSTANPEDSKTTTQEITDKHEDPENDDKVISEIEESNAEDAEDEGSADRHSIIKKEYDKMSIKELKEELDQPENNQYIQDINYHDEDIRSEFKLKFN